MIPSCINTNQIPRQPVPLTVFLYHNVNKWNNDQTRKRVKNIKTNHLFIKELYLKKKTKKLKKSKCTAGTTYLRLFEMYKTQGPDPVSNDFNAFFKHQGNIEPCVFCY